MSSKHTAPDESGENQGQFIIRGTIIHARTGAPLAGYMIKAFDVDHLSEDDFLGQGKGAKDGSFTIAYRKTDFVKSLLEVFFERGPDLILKVYDLHGNLVHQTQPRSDARRFESYAITLSPPQAQPPDRETLDRTYTTILETIHNLSALTGSRMPLTLRQSRSLVSGSGIDNETVRRLKRFLDYARLFRPRLAAYLADLDEAAWQSLEEDQFQALLARFPFSDSCQAEELDKFRIVMGHKPEQVPSEIEYLLGEALSREKKQRLRQDGIYTFSDVRETLLGKAANGDEGDPLLTGIAKFAALTGDLKAARDLHRLGMRTLADLSRMDLKAMTRQTSISASKLLGVRRRARAARQAVDNAITAAYRAAWQDPNNQGNPGLDFGPIFPGGDACQPCDECQSVLSEVAYLMDLINIIGRHYARLTKDEDAIAEPRIGLSLDDLEGILHRNFSALVVDCAGLEAEVPRMLICTEVLERYIVANHDAVADVNAIHSWLQEDGNADYKKYLEVWFNLLAILTGLSAEELRQFIVALRIDPADPDYDSQQVAAGQQHLGLIEAGDSYPSMPAVAPASVIESQLKLIDPVNLDRAAVIKLREQLPAIIKRQLYARWHSEDALLDPIPDALLDTREQARQQVLADLEKGVQEARYQATPHYFEALQAPGLLLLEDIKISTLLGQLNLSCGHDDCDRTTRLREAILAVRLFFEKLVLSQADAERPLTAPEWDKFESYETWRSLMLPQIYPELFFDLDHEATEAPFYRQGDLLGIRDALADSLEANPPGEGNPDGVLTAFDKGILTDTLSLTNRLRSNTYQDPTDLYNELASVHDRVWSRMPFWQWRPKQQPYVAAPYRDRYNETVAKARDPESILELDLCDWIYLQRETLRLFRKAATFPAAEVGGSVWTAFTDYDSRKMGGDWGSYYPYGHLHQLAFYILPRLWGKYYHRIQDFRRAVRSYHLIYNESLTDYALDHRSTGTLYQANGQTEGARYALTVGPIIYEHLRRQPPRISPFVNPLNRYDVEVRDITLLIARNYVDWADYELRRNTPESREQARAHYELALKAFGYSADGQNAPCFDPCWREAAAIEREVLKDLDYARYPELAQAWRTWKAQTRQMDAYRSLRRNLAAVLARKLGAGDARKLVLETIGQGLSIHHPLTLADIEGRKVRYATHHALANEDRMLATLFDPSSCVGAEGDHPTLPGNWPSSRYANGNVRTLPGSDVPIPEPRPDPDSNGGGLYIDPCRIMEDPPDIPEPSLEDEIKIDNPAICADEAAALPAFVQHALCVPTNPAVQSIVRRACLGLQLIRECRNILGYKNDYVPLYRFAQIHQLANDFATQAKSAENDFIRFTESYEQTTYTLLKELQAVEISRATESLNQYLKNQAEQNVTLVNLQSERVALQQEQVAKQLEEGETVFETQALEHLRWAIYWQYGAIGLNLLAGVVSLAGLADGNVGAIASPISSAAGAAAGMSSVQSTQAQIAQIHNSIYMRMEELRRTSELLAQDAQIASQNILIAEIGVDIAEQQLAIAAINAQFAADIVHFLQTKFFKGERYAWMAAIAKENYRTLLNYAIAAAWMAEQALEFERQRQINVIRFDYWREQDQGVMGIDQLSTDLATLKQERLVNEQRKHQVTKTISLAQISPIELAAFRESGLLYLTTLEAWFDRDFPTHFLRLIKGVSVTIVALVPPTEGIKAMLTQLGTTRTTLKRGPSFHKAEIKRIPERIAISSALGASGVFLPLLPEQELLNPFEGNGVEGSWLLEMPKASNPALNYQTIVDVQLTMQYTALDDPYKRPLLPQVYQGAANYSLNLSFADELYHLLNPDFYAPDDNTYKVLLRIDNRVLAPNQRKRRLKAVTLYFDRLEGSGKRPFTSLRHVEEDTIIWSNQPPNQDGLLRKETQNLETVIGTWEISFLKNETGWLQALSTLPDPPTLPAPPDPLTLDDLEQDEVAPYNLFTWITVNGALAPTQVNNRNALDLSWLRDILIMIEYEYTI